MITPVPACPTCRWYQVYGCGCVKPKCRFKRPELARLGQDCPRWTPKPA